MKMTFEEGYRNFVRSMRVGILDVDNLDLKEILNTATKHYLEIEISRLDLDNPDNDMLLFEYGNYDWIGDGKKFNLSVKRQLFFENLDECGHYGFTIYFDKTLVGDIEGISKWCANKNDTENWLTEINGSVGLQKVMGKPAMKFEVELEKPN